MKIDISLTKGMLPDRYGKYAGDEFRLGSRPNCSFPFTILEAPAGTVSYALAFVDFDAIPVGGFCWIHWLACNIPAQCTVIPENASAQQLIPMVQGSNSDFSPFVGGCSDPNVVCRYMGPMPPDKDHAYTLYVFALDTMLELSEGYYLNDFRRAIEGHVLSYASVDVVSRA